MRSKHNIGEVNSNDGPAGRPIPDDPKKLLCPTETAALLAVSVRTLEAWRLRGGGPPYVSLGAKAVRYRRGDLDDFIAQRTRRSTSDRGPSIDAR